MIRKILGRIVTGGSLGITIGFLMALVYSASYHAETFTPSSSTFVSHFGSNTEATAISAVLWFLMGVIFSVASIVFETEYWSITKRTLVHLVTTYALFTPLAIFAGWFPLQATWLMSYSIQFIIIYLIAWVVFMKLAKHRISQLNQLLNK